MHFMSIKQNYNLSINNYLLLIFLFLCEVNSRPQNIIANILYNRSPPILLLAYAFAFEI